MAVTSFGTSDEFARVVNSTTAEFFRKEEDNVLKKRRLTALMQSKGRVMKNEYGDEMKWPVRYRRSKPVVIGDVVNLNFPRTVKDKVAVVPWCGLAVTDALGEKEEIMNKGPAAIIKQTSVIMERLKEDMEDQFGLELYKDGIASPGRIHGLETCLGIVPPTNAAGDERFALRPSDTYAGHSTALGLLGTWNSTATLEWPLGSGDSEYEWWSPVIVAGMAHGFAGTAQTYASQCISAHRFGIYSAERTTIPLDMMLMSRDAYTKFVEKEETKEQINTMRGENSLLVKLGFGNVINFEGVDHTWEEGVEHVDTAVLAYGLTTSKMSLHTPMKQLFNPAPIDFAIEQLMKRYLVRFWGNLRLNPRHIVKIVNRDEDGDLTAG